MYTSLITVHLALLFNYYFVSVTTLHWKSQVYIYIYIYIYIYKVLQVILQAITEDGSQLSLACIKITAYFVRTKCCSYVRNDVASTVE
jgi:hypothetical protein